MHLHGGVPPFPPLLGPFRLQCWQKLIRMPVETQVTIQSHVHGNLRALRLTKSITQFEEPVSLPHITPIVSLLASTKRWPYTGLLVSRRNGSASPRLLTAPSLGGGGEKKSLEISRELLEQSPPITATSGDPEVFVSRRCIRMGKSRTDFCFQTLSWSKCLFRRTLMTDEGFQNSRAWGHRHRSRLLHQAGEEGKKSF